MSPPGRPKGEYRSAKHGGCLMSTESKPLDGGCTCRFVRLRLTSAPLFVHCCHCRWCQRESGSAFALNAMIEADRVQLLAGEVDVVDTPSQSGRGQKFSRCPSCRIALWSNYAGGARVLQGQRALAGIEPGSARGTEFAPAGHLTRACACPARSRGPSIFPT